MEGFCGIVQGNLDKILEEFFLIAKYIITLINIIKIIKSIFDHDGKSISIDMIRCIWKTTFIKPLYQAIEQDNTSMGHTEKVGKTYIKN